MRIVELSMENIPVTFECNGKTFSGLLAQVAGSGGNSVFHLMDNKNFYCGRLRYSDFIKDWVFDPTRKLKSWNDFHKDFRYIH